jgi:hypothetical protein
MLSLLSFLFASVYRSFELQYFNTELPRWHERPAHETGHVVEQLRGLLKLEGNAPSVARGANKVVSAANQEAGQVQMVCGEMRLRFETARNIGAPRRFGGIH